MEIQTSQNDRRELAVLFSMILKHPAMTPDLKEGIYGLFSDVHHAVDAYASPEGIELYLEAHSRLTIAGRMRRSEL